MSFEAKLEFPAKGKSGKENDDNFDIYLFLDLEKFYVYVGGSIAYILAILHLIIFFFSVFKEIGF